VRGDVCDGPGLAGSVSGMPCCPTQVSGRAHCMTARRASLGHLDLATHPGARMLDRLARSWILRPSQLEEVENVLCARGCPQSEQLVVRISEGPSAADRHEARVSDLREDYGWPPLHASAQHGRDPHCAAASRSDLDRNSIVVHLRDQREELLAGFARGTGQSAARWQQER
jgi:hypothetical protein